jgi:hypothetical protein
LYVFETSFRAYLNIHPSYPILYKHHTILHLEKTLKGEGEQRGGSASQGGRRARGESQIGEG